MEALRDRQRTDRTSAATLPSDGRAHNLSLVRQTLHSAGAMSRAELSRTLGLTRVTVSDLVSDLLERGHVVELGQSDEVRPGKPAILVDINRRGLQVIGMDLAENSVLRAAVLDLDGNILERVERSISERPARTSSTRSSNSLRKPSDGPPPRCSGSASGPPASSMRTARSPRPPTSDGRTSPCAISSRSAPAFRPSFPTTPTPQSMRTTPSAAAATTKSS